MKMFVTPEEFRMLRRMKEKKFEEVYLWCSICSEFLAATPTERKKVAMSLIQRYRGRGVRGMSLKSIYHKAKIYRQKGWIGFIQKEKDIFSLLLPTKENISANDEFLRYWERLCIEHNGVAIRAFNSLIEKLIKGDEIPGYGTWRDIYLDEHPSCIVPEICPYTSTQPPMGWSYVNLVRYRVKDEQVRMSLQEIFETDNLKEYLYAEIDSLHLQLEEIRTRIREMDELLFLENRSPPAVQAVKLAGK